MKRCAAWCCSIFLYLALKVPHFFLPAPHFFTWALLAMTQDLSSLLGHWTGWAFKWRTLGIFSSETRPPLSTRSLRHQWAPTTSHSPSKVHRFARLSMLWSHPWLPIWFSRSLSLTSTSESKFAVAWSVSWKPPYRIATSQSASAAKPLASISPLLLRSGCPVHPMTGRLL